MVSTSDTSLLVNGDDVIVYGLEAEHNRADIGGEVVEAVAPVHRQPLMQSLEQARPTRARCFPSEYALSQIHIVPRYARTRLLRLADAYAECGVVVLRIEVGGELRGPKPPR